MSELRPQEPMPAPEGQLELAHFTGTESYHRTHPGLLATDGAKYLADEAGACSRKSQTISPSSS